MKRISILSLMILGFLFTSGLSWSMEYSSFTMQKTKRTYYQQFEDISKLIDHRVEKSTYNGKVKKGELGSLWKLHILPLCQLIAVDLDKYEFNIDNGLKPSHKARTGRIIKEILANIEWYDTTTKIEYVAVNQDKQLLNLIHQGLSTKKPFTPDSWSQENIAITLSLLGNEQPLVPNDKEFESLFNTYLSIIELDSEAEFFMMLMEHYPFGTEIRSKSCLKEEKQSCNSCEVKEEKQHLCNICYSDEQIFDSICIIENRHEGSCKSCLERYIEEKIKENRFENNSFNLSFSCPEDGCKHTFNYKEWVQMAEEGLLTKGIYISLLKWKISQLTLTGKKFVTFCPNSDCYNVLDNESFMLTQTEYAQNFLADKKKSTKKQIQNKKKHEEKRIKRPTVDCNKCHTKICTGCLSTATGDCCGVVQLPAEGDYMACPMCETIYEKKGGCDYIKCGQCSVPFDIKTGKFWNKDYSDFEKGGSHKSGAITEENLEKMKAIYKK